MNYLQLLQESYSESQRGQASIGDHNYTKLEFLAENIFNFVTYENIVASLMAEKALEVCVAITTKSTFKYLESDEGNLWYLIMVNMPFFEDKIEWGTSIRGAWWEYGGISLEDVDLFFEGEQLTNLNIPSEEITNFVEAMLIFKGE